MSIKPNRDRKHVDDCHHDDEAYIGGMGRYDVYVQEAGDNDILTCMRDGPDGEYISGGGSLLQDVRALVRNLIREHDRVVGVMKCELSELTVQNSKEK